MISRIDQEDRERIDAFIKRRWLSMQMVIRGERIDLGKADGFYALEAGEIAGLVTFRICGREMEILSLDSVHEKRGIGTALLERALAEAETESLERAA